ncbi:hypothetical protein DM01DRAFT_1382218 [Hesseltinella vesiculosa]|uniref:DUF1690-domain-containing protein n=1 Tax=Hesseltinella vesiculosa TaxID=101127 RepID=A0A1X2GLP4_9FUNG|nr:hypothetical protein DM01DRAFT_1382218 [Hesseltinella vesiculosa]
MGATQSKSDPVIFYNQNVPLQFSQGLVDSLESRQKAPATTEELESIVRQRVAEELSRNQQKEDDMKQQLFNDIAKQNIDNDQSSVALSTDIHNIIQRIQRASTKEIPTEVIDRQEALVLCYKNNQSRVLDCWQEVEHFKESVIKAQKHFVSTHQ